MGKIDPKKCHTSGKVPLGESAKSNIKPSQGNGTGDKVRTQPTCSICLQQGQHALKYKMPRSKKRSKVDLVDCGIEETNKCENYGIKPRKRHKQLDLVIVLIEYSE